MKALQKGVCRVFITGVGRGVSSLGEQVPKGTWRDQVHGHFKRNGRLRADLQSFYLKIFKPIFLRNNVSGRNQEYLSQAYEIVRWVQWELQLQLCPIKREEPDFLVLCKPTNYWQWGIALTNFICARFYTKPQTLKCEYAFSWQLIWEVKGFLTNYLSDKKHSFSLNSTVFSEGE